ncbi:MAG: hypothetical protein PUC32_02415 [Oscillospiraceae bacterium]|nr:hypothetical protein [Oscillospiraceae bacterium]
MKKKVALILAALLCSATVAATMAGCGNESTAPASTSETSAVASETASETAATTVTLEEVRAANDVAAVLKDHTAITMETTNMNSDTGDVTAKFTSQYTVEDGKAVYKEISKDSKDNMIYSTETSDGASYTAFYENNKISQKLLTVVPEAEYDAYINTLKNPFVSSAKDDEKEVSCVPQDDVLILETTCSDPNLDDYTFNRYYYVDPQTKLVKAFVEETVDKDKKVISTQTVNYTYDSPVSMETEAKASISGDEVKDLYKVSAIITTVGETSGGQEMQEFKVAKGTYISVYTTDDQKSTTYTTLKDNEPSDPVEFFEVTKDDSTVYFTIEAK